MSERQRPYTTDADPGDETPADDWPCYVSPPPKATHGENRMTESECHEALMTILLDFCAERREGFCYALDDADLLLLEGEIRDFIRAHWPLTADGEGGIG